MTEIKHDTSTLISSNEDYTTYYCPHCDKPFAKGILISVKIVCPHCNEFFVMVGIGEESEK